jgi:NAD(P)-dependent dehydrogenase (short-subunit alcohol dehydrogenase family)
MYAQYNTNIYGVARVTRGALPVFRERKAGTIVNIGSRLGFSNKTPTCSLYGATKYALVGMTESLAAEVASFNIRVIIIEPGAFRTNFLSAVAEGRVSVPPEYKGTSLDDAVALYASASWKQPGDPAKAAPKMLDMITLSGEAKDMGGILRFQIGDDCHEEYEKVAKRMLEEAARTKNISTNTNHPDITVRP